VTGTEERRRIDGGERPIAGRRRPIRCQQSKAPLTGIAPDEVSERFPETVTETEPSSSSPERRRLGQSTEYRNYRNGVPPLMGASLEAARMHRLELEPGVTLLQVPSPRSGIVHRLVCDRLADGATGGDRPGGPTGSTRETRPRPTHCTTPRRVRASSRGCGSRGRLPPTSTTRWYGPSRGGRSRRPSCFRRAERRRSLYRDDDLAAWGARGPAGRDPRDPLRTRGRSRLPVP